MKKKNSLVLNKKENKLMKEIESEIRDDIQNKVKDNAKKLLLNIRRTEILLDQQKKQLDEIISGKKKYTEEEFLF